MIIAISRQIGSLGDEIAEKLAQELQMGIVTKEKMLSDWLPKTIGSYERNLLSESPKFYFSEFAEGQSYKEYLEKELAAYLNEHYCVVSGLCVHFIKPDTPNVLRLRTVANEEVRLNRIKGQYGIPETDAKSLLARLEKSNRRFINTLFGKDVSDPSHYDLIINTSGLDTDTAVRLIKSIIAQRQEPAAAEPVKVTETAAFKHPAEVEFAKILDMYHIDWVYEPHTFPVEWDEEGNVTLAFKPDFYLTKFNTYIEITTMNQKYVTTKNKKVRKLRELYPDVNIKIVYKKDFHSLLKRFGFGM